MQPSAYIALLLVGTAPAQEQPYKNYAPVLSPDGSMVAFYSTVHGDFDVYTARVDGVALRRLTDHPAYDGEPSWSPDGRRLVFVSDRDGDDELFLVDAAGGGPRQLTRNEARDDLPAWSPGSGRIVFRSNRDGPYRLYEIDPEDGTTQLFSDHAVEGRLRWSADGSQLVFAVEDGGGEGTAFVVLDSEGNAGEPVVLADLPGAGNPQISPDGTRVLFDAHSAASAESGDGLWELWTVDVTTLERTRLTTNDVDDWGASWSYDGTQIVFAGGGRDNQGYDIFLMSFDGNRRIRLTSPNLFRSETR